MEPTRTDEAALSFFVELAEDLKSTLDLDELLPRVAERVKPVVGYDTFGILLLDPMGTELRFRFGLGYRPEVMEHWRFGLGQGIIGTVAQTCEPLLVADVRDDARYINAHPEMRSELAIPLIAKHSTIGVLDVQSREPGFFTARHRRLLTFVAGYVASAIENARLYESLRAETSSLSLLNEVGRELTSILDRQQLLERIADLVKRVVPYHMFSMMLWDEDQQVLQPSFSMRFDQRFCNKVSVRLGEGITGTAAALRRSVRVPNVLLDPRYLSCNPPVEVRSELAVPLVFKDRLIGVLDLESTEYNAFSERHESVLSTLGSYVAVALENARLYDRVRRDENRLAEDLARAREIQGGLLPSAAPSTPGLEIAFAYSPANDLGGDIYDFLPYGEGRLAVMVGDVSGKATAAALQGSMAIGILRGLVVEHYAEPASMLRQINDHLLRLGLENRFVAMVFAIYDAAGRTLGLANGGFTRPHLIRGGVAEEIPVQGMPLGLLPDSRYEPTVIDLRAGDVVVFCSDGIHEAADARGVQFGVERLENVAVRLAGDGARNIADGLMQATDFHSGRATDHDDDRTVVVLKVTG